MFTNTTPRYLSAEEDWLDKNPEQRARHAQQLISAELNIPALKLTCHDVNEHKKTIVKQQAQSVDIDSLVRQVIEVLPNIPESEIRADLSKLHSYPHFRNRSLFKRKDYPFKSCLHLQSLK